MFHSRVTLTFPRLRAPKIPSLQTQKNLITEIGLKYQLDPAALNEELLKTVAGHQHRHLLAVGLGTGSRQRQQFEKRSSVGISPGH